MLVHVENLVLLDEDEGEDGGGEVDGGLDPEGQVFAAHIGQRGAHGRHLDKSLHTGCRGEEVAEPQTQLRHAALRPHHARQEEEHQAEEGEAEHGRQLLADEEVAHRHAEEDDRQQERQHEDEDGVEVAQLGQLEPTGDEPHGHDEDGGVDEQVAQRASEGHAVDAAGAQARGYGLQRPLVLAGVAAEQADAEEQRLVHHQHEQHRQEEAAVAPRGVEGRNLLVGDGLQLYVGVLAREACHCVALQLDGVHLVDEHGVGTQQGRLVVVERAHVGKDAHMGRLHARQPLREVLGEVEDGVYLVVLQ